MSATDAASEAAVPVAHVGPSVASSRGWLQDFHGVLDGVGSTSRFVTSGVFDLEQQSLPTAVVHNVGRLECPMGNVTLEALKIVANTCYREQATARRTWKPFETHYWDHLEVVNLFIQPTTARQTWVIDESLTVSNRVVVRGGNDGDWDTYLTKKVVEIWTEQLGFSLSVEDVDLYVSLHQLILTTTGDSSEQPEWEYQRYEERDLDVVGILVIQLPSQFTGGAVMVQGNKKIESFDLAEGAPNQCSFVAFYPDCTYKTQPVTSGVCSRLVYRISFFKRNTFHPDWLIRWAEMNESLQIPFEAMAEQWKTQGGDVPVARLGYKLDHEYGCNCTFGARFLKGRDRMVYSALLDAKTTNGEPLWDVNLISLSPCLTYRYPKKEKVESTKEEVETTFLRSAGTWNIRAAFQQVLSALPVPLLSRDFQAHHALNREGDTVAIVFNKSDGTTDGVFSMQEDGWLMDSKYFGTQTPWQLWRVVNAKELKMWGTNDSRPAAIFISLAKAKPEPDL